MTVTAPEKENSFKKLNNDIWKEILSFLTFKELTKLKILNKEFYKITTDVIFTTSRCTSGKELDTYCLKTRKRSRKSGTQKQKKKKKSLIYVEEDDDARIFFAKLLAETDFEVLEKSLDLWDNLRIRRKKWEEKNSEDNFAWVPQFDFVGTQKATS